MPLVIGSCLGPYEILAAVGAGGMGEVYRAHDTKLNRNVALKILPAAFALDPDRLARFKREAQLLASLNHANIASIYGLEESSCVQALVLELVDGPTLADRILLGPMALDEALAIARQITEALEAAHEHGIVHRDLKPANIKVRPDGTVKILDFGLAKALDPTRAGSGPVTASPTMTSPAVTGMGVILGTAAYMSPEQARGKTVDRRADIWAFGCILYEMITGRSAFVAETLPDTLVAILERQPDWSAFPKTTPLAVRRLVRRSLEKDPNHRLHDIADARIEIEDVTRDGLASRVPSESAQPAAHAARRRRSRALVVSAAVLLGLGAAAVARLRSVPVTSPGTVARLMMTLPATELLEKGRFPPLALSPDGKLLVYTAAADGGRTNLYLRPRDQFTSQRIPETEGASTPFFSPDGRWLAFYSNGALRRVSAAGGVPLTICDAPPVWGATWGANDTIVFATTLPSSGLWMVSANGGDPVQITTPKSDEAQHAYPQLLPDGTHLLFSVRRGSAWQLALLTLKTREWQLLGRGRVIGEGAQYLSTGHVVYVQSGGLVATPFDPSNVNFDQPPVPLLERVERSRFGGMNFAFAADAGTLVYVPSSRLVPGRALVRVDRAGRAAPLIDARAAYESPAISQDGRRVAVTIESEGGNDIWIIDLERATRIRFTTGGSSAFPVWAPGGSRLAFQSTAPGPWNLFWKPLDGSKEAQPLITASSNRTPWPDAGASLLPGTLPTLSGAPQFPTSWSPDGSTLAFHERKPNGERDIWLVSPPASPVPFVLTPFDERLPRFSPDGKQLAYVSDESGRNDVYIQPFPGPGPKWLVSPEGGSDPVWSRNGRELFYRHDNQLMVTSVTATGNFSAGRPRRLFELRSAAGDNGPNYDVSPDGQWFVMPTSDRELAAAELHVVLNWFSEIKARGQTAHASRTAVGHQWAARWEP